MTSSTPPAGDDSAWHREGPVRLLQGGQWTRKNGPVACDLCRKRRVRCSGFETGAPCDSCIRRRAHCVIADDTYSPDAASQTTVFIPILPPPPAPCASPQSYSHTLFALDFDAVCEALESAAPRPAPLIWRSPQDALLASVTSARPVRQKRPAVDYADEPAAQVVARGPRKKRAPSPPEDVDGLVFEAVDHQEPFDRVGTRMPRKPARRRVQEQHSAPQVKLRRHLPKQVFPVPPAPGLAVFFSRTKKHLAIAAYKLEPRAPLEHEADERLPIAQRFPLSSARDEPLQPPPPRTTPFLSSFDHTQYHPSSRRDSLISIASRSSGFSALFDFDFDLGAHSGGRRGSCATSVDDDEVAKGGAA